VAGLDLPQKSCNPAALLNALVLFEGEKTGTRLGDADYLRNEKWYQTLRVTVRTGTYRLRSLESKLVVSRK
jgi:hypothetical protein